MSAEEMLAVAAEVGYSETAFLDAGRRRRGYTVRYYSPLAEVPFCGHATIATGVALAERGSRGEVLFHTRGGPVPVKTATDEGRAPDGHAHERPAHVADLDAADLEEALAALRWTDDDLDPALPPRVAYAGAYHPIVAAATRERLRGARLRLRSPRPTDDRARLDHGAARVARGRAPVPRARPVPRRAAWSRTRPREPRPQLSAPTCASSRLVTPPATVTIRQGEDLGRPGLLSVHIPADRPNIEVTGTAVEIV